ncbi:MAG: 23S rRNA (pseudouridine(1915)-N(3))-methyltransferase RlmH [Halorhodospira sp.]
MRVHLVAVGHKPPRWVREGVEAYAQRLGRGWRLSLHEVPGGGSRGSDEPQAREREGERLLRATPERAFCIALDEEGQMRDTEQWARQLERWRHEGGEAAFLIGGADGLSEAVYQRADTCWSLSPLTLPHMLVRVLVAEQVYRAWTLLSGHPYHRA